MKAFITVFVYYFYLLRTTSTDHLYCKENEVLQHCKNPWEPTCSRPHPPVSNFFMCRPGCVCKPGCVRDESSRKCKLAKFCTKACPEGEVQNIEGKCEPTCQSFHGSRFQCGPKPKTCICKPGLLRDFPSGRCVPPTSCPKECGLNEEWNQCAYLPCRRTCQNRFKGVRACPPVCVPSCICKPGYIWDEHCRQCVLERDCPEECGENEEWQRCSDIKCRKTCQNLNETVKCHKVCTPGCSCKKDYVFDELQRKCVLKDECSHECSKNEEWRLCSDVGCRETCQRRPPKSYTSNCKAGCSCVDGYLWDETSKQCVPRWLCPEACGDHEEWCEYVPDDTPTCQSLLEPTCSRCNGPTIVSIRPGCICEKGFIWDEVAEKCISLDECFNAYGSTTESSSIATSSESSSIATSSESSSIATSSESSSIATSSEPSSIATSSKSSSIATSSESSSITTDISTSEATAGISAESSSFATETTATDTEEPTTCIDESTHQGPTSSVDAKAEESTSPVDGKTEQSISSVDGKTEQPSSLVSSKTTFSSLHGKTEESTSSADSKTEKPTGSSTTTNTPSSSMDTGSTEPKSTSTDDEGLTAATIIDI